MSEQILSRFIDDITPVIGLTPTITIRRTDDVVIINNDPMLEIGNWWYEYIFVDYLASTTYLIEVDWWTAAPDSCRLQSTTNILDSYPNKESFGKIPLAPLIQWQGKQVSIDVESIVTKLTKEIKAVKSVDLSEVRTDIQKSTKEIIKKVDNIDNSGIESKLDQTLAWVTEINKWKNSYLKENIALFDKYTKYIKDSIDKLEFDGYFNGIINQINMVKDTILAYSNYILEEVRIDRADYDRIDLTNPVKKIIDNVTKISDNVWSINTKHDIVNSIDRLENTISSMKINAKEKWWVDIDLIQSVVMKGINMVIDCVMDTKVDKDQQKLILDKLSAIKNNIVE